MISHLEHVVGDQHAPGLHQPEHIIQEVDVLPLRRIHKDQVKGRIQPFQNIRRVAFQKGDLSFSACLRKFSFAMGILFSYFSIVVI